MRSLYDEETPTLHIVILLRFPHYTVANTSKKLCESPTYRSRAVVLITRSARDIEASQAACQHVHLSPTHGPE